jgi:hypothetical protein
MWRAFVVALLLVVVSPAAGALGGGDDCPADDPFCGPTTSPPANFSGWPNAPVCAYLAQSVQANCYSEYNSQSQHFAYTGGWWSVIWRSGGAAVAMFLVFGFGLGLGRFV